MKGCIHASFNFHDVCLEARKMKSFAIFLLLTTAYASIPSEYEDSGNQDYGQDEYEPYRDRQNQNLNQLLRQVSDSIQYADLYIEGKLQEVQQYFGDYGHTTEEYDQRIQQLVHEVKYQASQLRQQVYQYLEHSQQQYSQNFENFEHENYIDDHYERQSEFEIARILQRVGSVLQRTQYYTEEKLRYVQQILYQYQQSDSQPSEPEKRLIQEIKSEADSLQQRVYQSLYFTQEHDNDDELPFPDQSEKSAGQVAKILYQTQYILQSAQNYSQKHLSRAQYILNQYGQTDYHLSQVVQKLVQEVNSQSSSLKEQIYFHTEYFIQNSGGEKYSPYSQQQYDHHCGYSEYDQQHYRSQSADYGSSESHQVQQYDRQLVSILSRVRIALKYAQCRSQERLKQAQELSAEEQSDDQPSQDQDQIQRLAQRLRLQANSLQQRVYKYLQYGQDGENKSTGYPTIRSELQRVRELVEEIGETESSSSDYQSVESSFEQRYGLSFSEDYYEFAKYLIQTYHTDLSSSSTSSTVGQIAQYFLGQIEQVGEGILRHALEFFLKYRSEIAQYYYQTLEDAVRQQLDS